MHPTAPRQPADLRMLAGWRPRRGGAAAQRWLPIILLGLYLATAWSAPALTRHSPGHEGSGGQGGGACDKAVDLTGQIHNARVVGLVDTGICSNGDLDLFVSEPGTAEERLYAVIAGGAESAFAVIDVTDPSLPRLIRQQSWQTTGVRATVTSLIRAFRRDGQTWLALGLSADGKQGLCGVVFVDDALNARGHLDRSGDPEGDAWCGVRSLFIESDVDGEAAFLFVATQESFDLRVFDLRGPQGMPAPDEVGRYRRTDVVLGPDSDGDMRGKRDPDGATDDIYPHAVVVAPGGDPESPVPTVYLAYMSAGLDIFPASLVRDATSATPTRLPPADQTSANDDGGVTTLAPLDHPSGAPFVVHDVVPDAARETVFLLDENSFTDGDTPVLAWRLGDAAPAPDPLIVGVDVPAVPPRHLALGVAAELGETTLPAESLVNRLTVGWYRLGLQGWDVRDGVFERIPRDGEPRTATVFHQARTARQDDTYDGAWATKIARIGDLFYGFVSDREFGLIVTCLGDGQGDLTDCPPAVQTQP